MPMLRSLISAALLLLVGALAQTAQAKTVRYSGPHAVNTKHADGMCFIEGPHAHSYAPQHQAVLYTKHEGRWMFIGDPTPFDSEAPRHAYYGHHPVNWRDHIVVNAEGPFCWISGPHHHWYEPAPSPNFAVQGDAHWYVGPKPKKYKRRSKRRSKHVDRYYTKTRVIARPVVVVTPPAGYFGVYVRGPWAPRGVTVEVGVPAPVHVIVPGVPYVQPVRHRKGKKWKGKHWKGKHRKGKHRKGKKWKGKHWKGKHRKGKKWKGKHWKGPKGRKGHGGKRGKRGKHKGGRW